MAGKKKKGKGKKKKKDLSKGPPKLVVPNFVPINPIKSPVAVKVHHFDDIFLIYTDEYHTAEEIFNEIGKNLNRDVKEMKLYFANKRLVEPQTTNHDQQIVNNIDLYLCMFKEKSTEKGVPDLWDNVKEVIGYNIYEAKVDDLEMPKEEEEGNQEEKI